ncbi:MAG: glycoside hydrolase family 19 protein [Massilia sp.]
MAVTVTLAQLDQLAPQCSAAYRLAFGEGNPVLARYGIAETALRVAHFMAQILHESGALTLEDENLRYSPQRLAQVWPHRFRPLGPLDPRKFAWNPEKLANEVYRGRMGNTQPGDGYLYRGRGMLQLTGRDNYAHASTLLRAGMPLAPDLTREPEAAVSAQWSLHVAALTWEARGCNAAADQDDVAKVSFLINGGDLGLAERIIWTGKTRAIWLA